MPDYYKSPWFLVLVGVILWGWGYITADDARVAQEMSCKWEK